jgi:hypothetical protein
MEEKGFIVLHRQILNWEWYDHLPTKVLFIHCLLRANHAEGKWRGQGFKRGQFITSLNSLATETGLTIKQVRIALENLEKTKELGKQTTSQNTLLTVLNYDLYQSKGTPKDKGGAKVGQSKGKGGATDNNNNNVNNIEERKQEFAQDMVEFSGMYNREMMVDFYEYWTEHGKNDKKMRFEKQSSFDLGRRLKTWERNQKPSQDEHHDPLVEYVKQQLGDKYKP